MEKVVVRELIYLALLSPPPDLTFADQFAFQTSGSTTAALVYLLRTISQLLTVNPYVIVIALDFSKAFDTVRHSSLLKKFAKLKADNDIISCTYSLVIGGHCRPHYISLRMRRNFCCSEAVWPRVCTMWRTSKKNRQGFIVPQWFVTGSIWNWFVKNEVPYIEPV